MKKRQVLSLLIFLLTFFIALFIYLLVFFIDEFLVREVQLSSSSCLSEDPALTLYFSFNDSTATDLSGNGNNGVINGAVPVSGRIENGFSFDGVDDYIDVGNRPSLDITGSFSIAAWIKPSSSGSFEGIVTKEGSNLGYYLWLGPSGGTRIGFGVNGGGAQENEIISPRSLTLNTWYHVVGVFNGTGKQIYIDGVLDTQGGNSQTPVSTTGPLYIGGSNAGSSFRFPGVIDEVMVFNRALNVAEILNIYNNKLCEQQQTPQICTDTDGDGYGIGCSLGNDCNDNNANINPGRTEICDGIDNDCDSQVDEGCNLGTVVDNSGSGFSMQGTWLISGGENPYGLDSVYSRTSGDSATWTATLNPGIYNVYAWWTYWDSRSQNAPYFIYNGNIQLGVVRVNQRDIALASKWNLFGNYSFDQTAKVVLNVESGDSYNADAIRFVKVGDLPPACSPSTEVCDGVDNNCDSQVDEGVKQTFYIDADGDTYGAGSGIQACFAPQGYVANNLDCNDGNANLSLLKSCSYNGNSCGNYQLCVASCPVLPPEICGNGIDENCDGADDFCTGIAPTLTVFLPEEGKRYKNQLVPLKYTAKDASNCWYTINGARTNTVCVVSASLDLPSGTYLLQVFTNNSFGQKSEQRNFRVLLTRKYKINSDSFIERGSFGLLEEYTDAQLGSVQSLSVSLPNVGKVEWLETVDLTKDANQITSIIDLAGNIDIAYNRVWVKSEVMPSLNKRARITLEGISFRSPRILRDGNVCYSCVIESYSNGRIVFTVPGFSIYSTEETPIVTGENGYSGEEGTGDIYGIDDAVGVVDTESELQNILVGEEKKSFNIVNGENVVLDIDGTSYPVSFEIIDSKIRLEIQGRKYAIEESKVLRIPIGNDDLSIEVESKNNQTVIAAKLIRGRTGEKLVEDILSGRKKVKYGLISALVAIALIIVIILISILAVTRSHSYKKKNLPQKWTKEKRFIIRRIKDRDY